MPSTCRRRVKRNWGFGKPPEAQQSQSILSTYFSLKSNFSSFCKVRCKKASRLRSDKKNVEFIFATNIKRLLNKTLHKSLVYKLRETKQILKLILLVLNYYYYYYHYYCYYYYYFQTYFSCAPLTRRTSLQ